MVYLLYTTTTIDYVHCRRVILQALLIVEKAKNMCSRDIDIIISTIHIIYDIIGTSPSLSPKPM